MMHTKLKVVKMLDEMLNYVYSLGAKEANVNIKEMEDRFEIILICDCMEGHPDKKIDSMIKTLNVPREEEIEEYYWELAGDCDLDSELCIVGLMCDEAYVDKLPGDKLKIRLIRKK
ncbi:MAG: hypothetical protein LIR50_08545 [Bacillota bacterium]|nr:hypothetical protein [Bacillota bacterium]